MTLYEFNSMSEVIQTHFVRKNGVKIAEVQKGIYTLMLYQIGSFYAELLYDSPGDMKKLRAFISTEQLTPYLHQIDISELNF